MLIDWTDDFIRTWDQWEEEADAGSLVAHQRLELLVAMLAELQDLEHTPTAEDEPTFKPIRRSGTHRLYRISHPFRSRIAVRVVVWFHHDQALAVAVLLTDKAAKGDVFYDSVGSRADQIINQWMRDRRAEQPNPERNPKP